MGPLSSNADSTAFFRPENELPQWQQKNLILAFRRRWGTTPYAYRTGKLLRNGNYAVNKDYHSRKNALNIAKEHLDDIKRQ